MISHTINPVLVEIGFFQIRYYGLFYILGLALTYFTLKYLVKQRKLELSNDDLVEYVLWLSIGLVAGARVFYFIFYEPWLIWQNPLEIFRLWRGGMSFHGGLIGAVIGGYMFCRKNNINSYKMADITAIPLALALALGRIGNFINAELYGRLWDGALCIDYSQNPHLNNPPSGCRYPSQFVESAKNLFIFAVLWFAKDWRPKIFRGKKLPDGFLFWTFPLMYSFLRFFIEFIRQPDEQLGFILFGWMTMGQVLCVVLFALSGFMLWRLYSKNPG